MEHSLHATPTCGPGPSQARHGRDPRGVCVAVGAWVATRRTLLLWLLCMACADAALWGVYAALAAQQPASRRACNAAYMAWLLALNLLLLLALACVDALSRALGAHGAQARAPARAVCTPGSR